jgi:hypothetical protein
VQKTKLGADDELAALQKLDRESPKLERVATDPALERLISDEFEQSAHYGGRSACGRERPQGPPDGVPQTPGSG